ncbi:UNVERIFIED_CONTAM: hypothetical protein GTU68_012989 [Idotea baltica]|nr:hypothetical protein [Idotea baltica]
MINSPEDHVKRFIDAGASRITFHIEACRHAHRLAQHITELGAKPGIALNPGTSVNSIEPLLSVVDLVLLMTVNPGWGGQAFIPNSLSRLELAKSLIEQAGTDIILQVDGGISAKTAEAVRNAGANSLVAGTAVFKSDNYAAAIKIIGGR